MLPEFGSFPRMTYGSMNFGKSCRHAWADGVKYINDEITALELQLNFFPARHSVFVASDSQVLPDSFPD